MNNISRKVVYGMLIVIILTTILYFLIKYFINNHDYTNEKFIPRDYTNDKSINNTTIVSGYWVVKNKHNNKYDEWFEKTLRINCPYVFFGTKETIKMAKKYRRNLPTHYIRLELDDFETKKYKNDFIIDSIHAPSAELNMIWNEKIFLIQKAKNINPFNSEYFVWCDAGICIYRENPPPIEPIPLLSFTKDKFIYTESNPMSNDDIRYSNHHISGTFLIHKDFIDAFTDIYKSYQDKLIPRKDNIYTDQVIYTHIFRNRPELFLKVGTGYGKIIELLYNKKIFVPILVGGLGNQLFILLSTYFMAMDNNSKCFINSIKPQSSIHTNINYSDNIFKKFKHNNTIDQNIMTIYNFSVRNDETKKFAEIDTQHNLINGYLQNYNHFHNHYDKIEQILELPITPKREIFFLHVRLGDFNYTPGHILNLDNYYKKAIDFILNKFITAKFVLFSDEPDNAKRYIKNIYPTIMLENNTFNNNELEELSEMRNCRLGGISGHSTFAWWGGYLNDNPNKIIILPDKFTNGESDFSGMFYPNVIIMTV